jgi:hypothetical protein
LTLLAQLLGILFEKRGEYDLAEEAYQQAIDSEQRSTWICSLRKGKSTIGLRKLTNRRSIPDIPRLLLRECTISEGCP